MKVCLRDRQTGKTTDIVRMWKNSWTTHAPGQSIFVTFGYHRGRDIIRQFSIPPERAQDVLTPGLVVRQMRRPRVAFVDDLDMVVAEAVGTHDIIAMGTGACFESSDENDQR